MKLTSLKTKVIVAAAFAAFSLASSAQAQVVFFGQTPGAGEGSRVVANAATLAAQSNFLGALSSPGIEDFEVFVGNSAVFGNGVTATLVGGSRVFQGAGTNGVGRYPTSGTYFWESAQNFSLTFSSQISAFGFFGVDIGDFNGQLSLGLFNGAVAVGNQIVPNTLNGAGGGILYFGVINNLTFDRVVFGNTAPGTDFFAFDDFTVGVPSQVVLTAVPEPSTYGIIGAAALMGVALFRRRQQAKRAV